MIRNEILRVLRLNFTINQVISLSSNLGDFIKNFGTKQEV